MPQNKSWSYGPFQLELLWDGRSLRPQEKRILWKSIPLVIEDIHYLMRGHFKNYRSLQSISLSLTLCGNRQIQKLNAQYRGKDSPTDVLSFPVHEDLRSQQPPWTPFLELGDLVISLPKTREQAQRFAISFEQELWHLLTHGVLHLVGYDHELSEKEEALMSALEEKWVGQIYKSLYNVRKKKGIN